MKVVFATFFSCLALIVGMLATTGTASAHTTSSAHPAHFVDPRIHVAFVSRSGGDCTTLLIVGRDFSSFGRVRLFVDSLSNFDVRIFPRSVRANFDGDFATLATVCADFQFQSCGDFIDNPFFFCGFGLNPHEFCNGQFGGEVDFCFNGQAQNQFSPISTSEFCQFHNEGFCFRFHRHSILVFIAAVDRRSGEESNTVAVRIFRPFFF